MKIINIILIILGITFLLNCRQKNIVELPLTKEKGYGPFEPGLRGLTTYSDNSPLKKTHLTISGLPQDWTNVKSGDIETNIYQSVYQNYLHGKINKQMYESLQKAWGWIPDTMNLSKEPIKCKIAFAFGADKTGELKIIVDANNNYNLSDDKIIKPIKIYSNNWGNLDSLALTNSVTVKYERFLNNKIVEVNAPILIVHQNQSNRLMYNFPQYSIAKLKGKKIAICSSGFSDLSYYNSTMVLLNENNEQREKGNPQETFLKNSTKELINQNLKSLVL